MASYFLRRCASRVVELSKNAGSAVIFLFFGLVSTALFLGDGKDAVTDAYCAAGLIAIVAYYVYRRGAFRLPDKQVVWLGLFVIVGIGTAVFNSSDLGLSIVAGVRYALAVVVFLLFYGVGSERRLGLFARLALLFVTFAAASSFLFETLPIEKNLIPSMNQLGLAFGHNHLAEILVFGTPVFVLWLSGRAKKYAWVLWAFFALIVYFTQARGAWVIIGLYVAWNIWRNKNLTRIVRGGTILLIALGAGVLVAGFMSPTRFEHARLSPSHAKTPLNQDKRIYYWGQAVSAFKEKPLFGNGLGTFVLIAKRVHPKQGQSSWYAHSAPLQMLAETGLVGAVPVLLFILVVAIRIHKYKKRLFETSRDIYVALCVGILLIGLYSLYEFVLDFLVIWLLVTATGGFLLGITNERTKGSKGGLVFGFLSLILGVYYGTYAGSLLLLQDTPLAYKIAPYSVVNVQYMLEKKTHILLSKQDIDRIEYFHPNHPDVLRGLGLYYSRHKNFERARDYYRRAVYADPQNPQYYREYFELLGQMDLPGPLGQEILAVAKRALPEKYHAQLNALTPHTLALGEYYKNWIIAEKPTYKHGFSGLFYRLGIADLRPVEPTEKLLVLARDLYPDLAHLHIELAAYYQHIANEPHKAQNTLLYCQKYPSAAKQCEEQARFPLYYPAEYKEVVW